MMNGSRAAEIFRARDQLRGVLEKLRETVPPQDVEKTAEAQQVFLALAAGLDMIAGVAVDVNRIADALDRQQGNG